MKISKEELIHNLVEDLIYEAQKNGECDNRII
jgi:hypothetical protein